jgi:hypothetical protein
MRVLLSKNESRAVFAKRLRLSGDDPELHALAYELQQPLVLATKQFGKLTLDRGMDWFCGKARWNGRKVDINFPTDGGESIDGGLATAELLWKRQAEWKRKVDGFAVQELLPIRNEHWLSEGEKTLPPKQFKARMKLNSISISSDGQFEFWHDDGDMFYGHSIQVCGSLRAGLTRADIPGQVYMSSSP